VKVDDQVEAFAAQPTREGPIVKQPTDPAWPLGNDHVIKMWIVTDHRFRRRFHQIRQSGVGKVTPEGRDHRGRKNHIADEAQADEKDGQGSTVASSISITGMSSLIG
jgi:hypothetical protein